METKGETRKVAEITEKQKAARKLNLAKGRAKKQSMMAKKKEEPQHEEYDIGSDDEYEADQSSDDETFVISKQKSKQNKSKPSKETKPSREDSLKGEVDELKTMIMQLAKNQKAQNKQNKERRPKISVLLPTSQPQDTKKANPHYDSVIANLQARLGL